MRVFILLLTMCSAVLASSQTALPATANEPRAVAEKAMKFLATNDLNGMFKYIQTVMPMDKAELDKIRDTSITQRKTLPATLGEYVG